MKGYDITKGVFERNEWRIMTKNKVVLITLAVLALCVLGVIGVMPGAKEKPPLRIGMNFWPGCEFLYLADKKGFFKDEGVNISLHFFSTLEEVRHSYEQEKIDGMAVTMIEMLLAHENGRDSKIAMVMDFSNGADVILAHSDIQNIKALHHKKIAVEPMSLGFFMLMRALEKAEMTLSDVEVVAMGQQHMAEALVKGKVDAVVTFPPVSVNIQKYQKDIVTVFDSSQIPGEVVDILSFDAEIFRDRKEDIAALKRAWGRALEYATLYPEEAYKIMARHEKISPEEFVDALEGIKILGIEEQKALVVENGALDRTIQATINGLRSAGKIQKNVAANNFIVDH